MKQSGGAASIEATLLRSPQLLEDRGQPGHFGALLKAPDLLPLKIKKAFVDYKLGQMTGERDANTISVHRTNVLLGLSAMLGVDRSGQLIAGENSIPRGVAIRFHGERAIGDGLRREWFGLVVAWILSPARGLFTSKDGTRLQPK